MTFDPRTLPNGDFWPSFGLFMFYAAMLADCIVTRYGIWVKGYKEANKLMAWFTDRAHVWRTFVDGAVLRPAVTFGVGSLFSWGGIFDNAHAWATLLFSAPVAVLVVRNLLKLRK